MIITSRWGSDLTERDYTELAKSWITPELANVAMLRRVTSEEGRQVVGQGGSRDCAGILIPYYWPGDESPFNYRLRRDNPEWSAGRDGQLKADRKYLGAPGGANRLYVPRGVTLEQLNDGMIPLVVAEGEKKCLALWRLALYATDVPRFIPVAIPGVWNWRGVIGKGTGPNGERVDIRGPIPDLARIRWAGRKVYVIFDSDVSENEKVANARRQLTRELTSRGAVVAWVQVPSDVGVRQ